MTISITHPFVSAKGDGTDATLVRPSNWNANHTTSIATNKLIGRLTAGAGAFEEIALSAFVAAALGAADAPAFFAALGAGGFETGDVKFSLNPTASTGWLSYSGEGTLGDATSGATIYANAAASALYQIIYNNTIDTWCPVSGGRTGNALNDFNAHKTIALPRFAGRTVIGAGTGSGMSARVAAQYLGAETHMLLTAELATHSHANSLNDPSHSHVYDRAGFAGASGASGSVLGVNSPTGTSSSFTGMTITNANAGSNTPHNNMQPSVALWAKVKL